MKSDKIRGILTVCAALFIAFQASAQNKDIEKGKATLAKAMEQKDPAKKNEMVQEAVAQFQKGGMKREMYALVGDAYLDKSDLQNAATNYSRCDKTEKFEGLKKVAEAYVDEAFNAADVKGETKSLRKAMDYFNKSQTGKEGARTIGDRYYAKGIESYPKAVEYYFMGDAPAKIEQIANDYFKKGGDNEAKAAEVYLKMKTPDGYKKGGDIYFNKKEYQKAIDAYVAGNVAEGIKKYADYLYGQNHNEDADNYIVKVAEIYAEKKDDAALEKIAVESQNKGSYRLAARIYEKAGNMTMSDKSRGIDRLIAFDLDSAKMYFVTINDAYMVKLITDNTKLLMPLKDIADNFDEVMRAAPFVTLVVDSITGMSLPSASDQKTQEDYYKSVRDQIVNNVYAVSADMAKLTNPDLKKYARLRFMRYGAIRNILDTQSFAIKKVKLEIRVKDVVL